VVFTILSLSGLGDHGEATVADARPSSAQFVRSGTADASSRQWIDSLSCTRERKKKQQQRAEQDADADAEVVQLP